MLLLGVLMLSAAPMNLKVGQSIAVDEVSVKLVSVKAYPGDPTDSHRKADVALEVSSKSHAVEEISVGGYSETSVFRLGHLFSLVSTKPNEAVISANPFKLTWASNGAPVELGKPTTHGDLSVTVKDFTHVSEYGAYFTLPLDFEHGGQKRSFNQNPITFLGLRFEVVADGLKSAMVKVTPVRLGEPFELEEGQSMKVEGVGLTLVSVTDEPKQHRMVYEFRVTTAAKPHTVQLVLPFTERHEAPPEGKIDEPQREFRLDAATVDVGGYALSKAAGSTDYAPLRRGPFVLRRGK